MPASRPQSGAGDRAHGMSVAGLVKRATLTSRHPEVGNGCVEVLSATVSPKTRGIVASLTKRAQPPIALLLFVRAFLLDRIRLFPSLCFVGAYAPRPRDREECILVLRW